MNLVKINGILLNGALTGAGTGAAIGAAGNAAVAYLVKPQELKDAAVGGFLSGAIVGADAGLKRAGSKTLEHLIFD